MSALFPFMTMLSKGDHLILKDVNMTIIQIDSFPCVKGKPHFLFISLRSVMEIFSMKGVRLHRYIF